jgi:hypothetical protein
MGPFEIVKEEVVKMPEIDVSLFNVRMEEMVS